MSSADIVIAGGTIVDGTGAPGRPGAVIVEGDRLRVVVAQGDGRAGAGDGRAGASGGGAGPDAALPEQAGRWIDATGKVVAPGFIDLHSHSGLMILADPLHEPKVRQGVTTEVIGVDGNSYAPFDSPEDLRAFV